MEILLFIVFLGLTQGFTEFLPISSSGHLALFENLPVFQSMKGLLEEQYSLLSFNVILHLGTILAVIFYWRKDILQITLDFFEDLRNRKNGRGMFLVTRIAVSTLPVFSVPFFKSFVEDTTHSIAWISLFFVINGFLLVGATWFRKKFRNETGKSAEEISWFDALWIGVFQVFAVFPGISRSGSTITAALLRRIGGVESVRYSFLISVPVLVGAALFEIKEIGFIKVFSPEARIEWVLAGLVSAFIAGIISLRLLVWLGRKVLFYPFGIYTFILGVVVYSILG